MAKGGYQMGAAALSWREVELLCADLARSVERFARKVSYIAAVTRGGWVPARVLATQLGIRRMGSISVVSNTDGARVVSSAPADLDSADHVLLVEDAVVSGESLEVARRHLAIRVARVTTAALIALNRTQFQPELVVRQRADVPTMPWERVPPVSGPAA